MFSEFLKIKTHTMKNLTGIIVGALAGITAGILLAPDSGNKTRKSINKGSDKWRSNFDKQRSNFDKQFNEGVDVVLKNLSKAIGEYSKRSQKSLNDLRKSAKR